MRSYHELLADARHAFRGGVVVEEVAHRDGGRLVLLHAEIEVGDVVGVFGHALVQEGDVVVRGVGLGGVRVDGEEVAEVLEGVAGGLLSTF